MDAGTRIIGWMQVHVCGQGTVLRIWKIFTLWVKPVAEAIRETMVTSACERRILISHVPEFINFIFKLVIN
jgi:hypothetical protein